MYYAYNNIIKKEICQTKLTIFSYVCEELSSTNSDDDDDVDIYMRNKYGSIYEDSTWC